jgi:hypothetical protein
MPLHACACGRKPCVPAVYLGCPLVLPPLCRVTGFLGTLYREHSVPKTDNVLIVSHGLTMRLFLMRWWVAQMGCGAGGGAQVLCVSHLGDVTR